MAASAVADGSYYTSLADITSIYDLIPHLNSFMDIVIWNDILILKWFWFYIRWMLKSIYKRAYLSKRIGPDNCRDNHASAKYIVLRIRGYA